MRALDADAVVDVDLSRHLVRMHASHLDAPRVREALEQAGYCPVDVAAPESVPAAVAGCCGCVSVRCGCSEHS